MAKKPGRHAPKKRSHKPTAKKKAELAQSMHGVAFAIHKGKTEEYPGETVGAQELARFMKADSLSRERLGALMVKLAKLRAKKGYHRELGIARLKSHAKKTAKRYAKEVRGKSPKEASRLFSTCDVDKLARALEQGFQLQWRMGFFESILPVKLQKPATRKATKAALTTSS